jgi:hypothetical protein
MKRVRSLVEQLQDEERRIQRLKSPLGMDDGLGMDVVAPCAPTQPTGSSMHAEAVAVEERMELEDRALVEDRREEQLESSVGAAATSESAATMAPAKAEAAAADAASAPRGGSTASSSTLTMMVLDLQEAADHSMHIYGVLLGGGSALLNVSGFRNFFYLELRELAAHPAATASTYPLADAGVLAAENDDERIAAMVVDALAADGQLKLGRSAASEQLAVRPVRRMPLLACYQHVVGAVAGTGRSAAALPTSAAALTVRLLRVEFAPPLKPKGLLEALGRAIQPADSPLRQHLQIDEQQQIVSFESQMAPAGTSALARRFAIEKDLAGGAWLTARNALRRRRSRSARLVSTSSFAPTATSPGTLLTFSPLQTTPRSAGLACTLTFTPTSAGPVYRASPRSLCAWCPPWATRSPSGRRARAPVPPSTASD